MVPREVVAWQRGCMTVRRRRYVDDVAAVDGIQRAIRENPMIITCYP